MEGSGSTNIWVLGTPERKMEDWGRTNLGFKGELQNEKCKMKIAN
jgi:hypothetical protein